MRRWFAEIVDVGTFKTISGAKSPHAGTDMKSVVSGKVEGKAHTTTFFGHYKGDWADGKVFTGAGGTATGGPTDANWVKEYFDRIPEDQYSLPVWSWTYSTCHEKYIRTNEGEGGDITGKPCSSPNPTPSVTPTPKPSATPTPKPSATPTPRPSAAPTPSATPTSQPEKPGLPNTGAPIR